MDKEADGIWEDQYCAPKFAPNVFDYAPKMSNKARQTAIKKRNKKPCNRYSYKVFYWWTLTDLNR